jgi:hypothetical protein
MPASETPKHFSLPASIAAFPSASDNGPALANEARAVAIAPASATAVISRALILKPPSDGDGRSRSHAAGSCSTQTNNGNYECAKASPARLNRT